MIKPKDFQVYCEKRNIWITISLSNCRFTPQSEHLLADNETLVPDGYRVPKKHEFFVAWTMNLNEIDDTTMSNPIVEYVKTFNDGNPRICLKPVVVQ